VSAATAGLRSELAQAARQAPAGALTRYGLIALVLGGAAFVWSLMGGHTDRAWEGYHTSFLYFTGLAQGLVIFAATQKAARSHWAGLIIRLAEAGVAFVMIAPILYLGLVLGRGHLFAVLPTDHPLTSMPNVVLTPHIGGATWNTEARQAQMVADDLEALLSGHLGLAAFSGARTDTAIPGWLLLANRKAPRFIFPARIILPMNRTKEWIWSLRYLKDWRWLDRDCCRK